MLNLETPRTPSGLGFLFKELQTLKGELIGLERQASELPDKIESRKVAIAAIELAIRRHPTKPDPTLLPAVRRNASRSGGYGKLSKQVFNAFREIGPRQVETREITDTIIRQEGLVFGDGDLRTFHKNVLKHLNYFKVRGHVVLINDGHNGGRTQSVWTLAIHPEDGVD